MSSLYLFYALRGGRHVNPLLLWLLPSPSWELVPFPRGIFFIFALEGPDSLSRGACPIFAFEGTNFLLRGAHFPFYPRESWFPSSRRWLHPLSSRSWFPHRGMHPWPWGADTLFKVYWPSRKLIPFSPKCWSFHYPSRSLFPPQIADFIDLEVLISSRTVPFSSWFSSCSDNLPVSSFLVIFPFPPLVGSRKWLQMSREGQPIFRAPIGILDLLYFAAANLSS